MNLGHPSKERLLQMLNSAAVGGKAIETAKKLICGVCASHKLPQSHKVAKHKRAEGLNQQVGVDAFDLPIYQGKTPTMLSVVVHAHTDI